MAVKQEESLTGQGLERTLSDYKCVTIGASRTQSRTLEMTIVFYQQSMNTNRLEIF